MEDEVFSEYVSCFFQEKTIVYLFRASVAQWIEHLSSEQGVVGSTPARRTL